MQQYNNKYNNMQQHTEQARTQASQKGGYIFSPVHIHLASHMHVITIIQIIVEGLILIKHNMQFGLVMSQIYEYTQSSIISTVLNRIAN